MTKGTRTHAVFEFTFACGETGATHTCRWEAEADDSGDKGINKVATAAEKYFLLKTFIVSTGDEPDADKEEGLHPSPTAPAQPKNGTPPPIATWKQNLKALEALVLKQVYNGNRFHMEGSFKKAEAEGDLKPDMTVEQAAIALKQRKLRAMAPKQAPQPAADFQYHVGDTVTFPPDRVTEEHLPLVYKVTATHPEAGTVEIFTAPTADNPIRLTVPAADVEPCDDVPF